MATSIYGLVNPTQEIKASDMVVRSTDTVNVLELRYSLNDWSILLGQTLFTADRQRQPNCAAPQ